MSATQAYSLTQLNGYVATLLAADPKLQGVWVVAETSDVRLHGGHCYLELVEKDAEGRQIAKARATIWMSAYQRIARAFYAQTGEQFRTDLRVMVCVSVNFHPLYGYSLNITDINPAYTMGEVMRRRREILERLQREGILNLNRQLQWTPVPLRVAIVSAAGAAGYGDFIKHLYENPYRLRFSSQLFPAYMQGERTVQSIIDALHQIGEIEGEWDCVVIIRGGGASSELTIFDNYELAAEIARFPIPVVIGIGHERDTSVLDYVANMRVKTPTAAADWLIQRGAQALGALQAIANAMLQTVTERMSSEQRRLAYFEGLMPATATAVVMRAQRRLLAAQMGMASVGDRLLRPALARLDAYQTAMLQSAEFALGRARQRLDAMATLLDALSPQSTLRRGYSITRLNGHALSSAAQLRPGDTIVTILADGQAASVVSETEIASQP